MIRINTFARYLLAAAIIWAALPVASAQADVMQAYQRELAFLAAERDSLKSRLGAVEAESGQKIASATGEVDRLQGSVLSLSMQSEALSEMLSDVERQAEGASEGDDQIEGLLTQAAAALEKGGISLPEVTAPKEGETPSNGVDRIRFAFTEGLALLKRFSSVRKVPGEFFDDGGQKVTGEVIELGQVAAFGVSDTGAGALAPAGAGRLKLWPGGDSAEIAKALAAGGQPEQLKLFLYESLDKGVEKKQDRTAVEVVESGGVIGWVIVAAGAVALLMALLRAMFLWRAAANTNSLLEEITPLVAKKRYDDAIKRCDETHSAGGRVLVATLKNIDRDRLELEDIVQEAILHEQPVLDRFGSMIIVVAAVAPLLGLLGTVTGMIATFDIITEFGTGNPKLLSGGIAIALVTTELGLIVAIPALIVGNMLSSWAEGIKDTIDKAALRVINVANGIRVSTPPTEAHSSASDVTAAPVAG